MSETKPAATLEAEQVERSRDLWMWVVQYASGPEMSAGSWSTKAEAEKYIPAHGERRALMRIVLPQIIAWEEIR